MMNQSRSTILIGIAVMLLALAVLLLQDQIHNLKTRVSCLEHPHQESSVAGLFKTVNGKRTFVVTQKPHRTGCK